MRRQSRRLAVATGIVVALAAAASPTTASAEDYPPTSAHYPPGTVTTTTPTTHPPPSTIPQTGSDGIGEMLATGAAFGVAGLGMVMVARRRRQPAG